MGCISAKSKLSAFDLHHLCHHFKCIYAKENLKTNIMKSFKYIQLGKAIGNAFADGKQLK